MQSIFFSWTIATIAALAPAIAMAGDSENKAIAEQIATVLRDSGKMQNYSVGVQYKDGTVWLTGRIANDQQMQAALRVVSDVEGVEKIVNSLEVAKASGRKATSGKGSPGQSAAGRPATRRVSATSNELAVQPENPAEEQAMQADSDVTPAGFHRLAGRRAARHAGPVPTYAPGMGSGPPPAYDQPHMPNYAWPSYAAYPNYAALTYPKQYSPSAWPYIGPFYPYPQVPLGWRKVSLEWDDGWWYLDFFDRSHH